MRSKIAIFALLFFVVIIVIFLVIKDTSKNHLSSLEVITNPSVEVFVDGKSLGKTPFEGTLESKKVIIKLATYEAQVYLQPGIKTVIDRTFISGTDQSYGALLSFEKTGLSTSLLTVVSDPIGASVIVDDKLYGTTPFSLSDLVNGKHSLSLSLTGYTQKDFSINLVKGYKLIASIDLSPQVLGSNSKIETKKDNLTSVAVRILSTPNGFLRVRKLPSTASSEVGRVSSGQEYPLKSIDSKTGWYEISINATSSGWISNVYAATSSSTLKD